MSVRPLLLAVQVSAMYTVWSLTKVGENRNSPGDGEAARPALKGSQLAPASSERNTPPPSPAPTNSSRSLANWGESVSARSTAVPGGMLSVVQVRAPSSLRQMPDWA